LEFAAQHIAIQQVAVTVHLANHREVTKEVLRTDSSPVGSACIQAGSSVIDLIARRLHDKLRLMKSTPTRCKSEFPIIISRGSVRVRIYRIVNRGRNIFTVAYRRTDGKRVRTTRSSLGAAKIKAERVATSIADGEIQALTLSNTDHALGTAQTAWA
jgi:hypothetical protein